METHSRIYVAGHRGLVGSAIVKVLKTKGYDNILFRTHKELDLEDYCAVDDFFSNEKPEYVFLAAAFVGGIMANNTLRADFIIKNLALQINVIKASYKYGVKKLLFLGSTCIYPKFANQPIMEESLLTGELEYTNEPYAIAKIAGIKMCESMNLQYGTNFISCMPTNLYGPNDNFDLLRGHVLPVILRKIHIAKMLEDGDIQGIINDFKWTVQKGVNINVSNIESELSKFGIYKDRVELWGTGNPLREFLWSEDMADACVFLMNNVNFSDLANNCENNEIRNCHINIGTEEEISIAKLSDLISTIVGYKGKIVFDSTKPDGTMRKLTSCNKIRKLGWKHKTKLIDGISILYNQYKKRINNEVYHYK